jgi:hypothetical protein
MKFVAAVTAAALVMVPTCQLCGKGAGGAGSGTGSAGSVGVPGIRQPSSQGQWPGNPSQGGINNNSMPGTGQGGGG